MSVVTLTVVAARALRIAADATIAKASTIAKIRTLFPARRSNLPPISVVFLLIILTILKFGYGFPVHPRVFLLEQARLSRWDKLTFTSTLPSHRCLADRRIKNIKV